MPITFEFGFEHGNFRLATPDGFADGWTTKVDTTGRMSCPGPRQLAADGWQVAPYRGGGIGQVNFSRSATEAYVQHDSAFDLVSPNVQFGRVMINPYMIDFNTSLDKFDFLRFISGTTTVEIALALAWHEPEGLVIDLAGNTAAIEPNTWTPVEWELKAGVGGYCKVYVGSSTLMQAKTVASIVHGQLGVIGTQTGALSRGALCFDEFFISTTRLNPPLGPIDALHMDGASLRMRKPGFAFVGSGEILSVQLVSGASATNNRIAIYDTPVPQFSDDDLKELLTCTVQDMTKINQRVIRVEHGAWLEVDASATGILVIMQLGAINEVDYYGDTMVGESEPEE
jgi:hypothetical protein